MSTAQEDWRPATTQHTTRARDVLDAGAPDSNGAGADLDRLRTEIENIDRSLIALIARRTEIARHVGHAKRRAGLPTLDPAREAAVVRRAGALARDAGVNDDDIRAIFWHLIGISRRVQLEES